MQEIIELTGLIIGSVIAIGALFILLTTIIDMTNYVYKAYKYNQLN